VPDTYLDGLGTGTAVMVAELCSAAGFYDDAGFCQDCDAPSCYRHWHVSQTGYGHCPAGHGKSLDPHW
jgi:hypothetical protein